MPVTEEEVRNAAIKVLRRAPNKTRTTTELIEILSNEMDLDEVDLEILDNRGDTRFSQKVRNLVCHRNQGTGLVVAGIATYRGSDHSWTLNT